METVVDLINSLGFPVVVCIALFYALKYVYDTMKAQNEKQAEETKAITEALNNNTLVLQMLTDRLDNVTCINPPEYTTDETAEITNTAETTEQV